MAGQDAPMSATRPIPRPAASAPPLVVALVAAIVLVGLLIAAFGEILLALILYLPNVLIGALLVIRRPWNPIGWLLIGIGWAFVGGLVSVPATARELLGGTASPVALLAAWWSSWSWFGAFALYLALMVIFPAGHLPTGRWRGPAALAIAGASFAVVVLAQAPTIDVHRWIGAGG
jgi:hypothetical protein